MRGSSSRPGCKSGRTGAWLPTGSSKLTPAKTGYLDRRSPPPRRLFYRLPSGIGLFQPLLLRSVIGDVRLSAGSGVPGEGETNDRAIATPQTNQGTGGSRSATLLSGAACGERTAVLALRRSRTWSTSQPSTSAFSAGRAAQHVAGRVRHDATPTCHKRDARAAAEGLG